jgi:uncharacterized protein YuzE
MKLSCDPEVDALSIVFRETTVTTQRLAEGIAADYDAEGRLAGLEVLDAVRRFGDKATLQRGCSKASRRAPPGFGKNPTGRTAPEVRRGQGRTRPARGGTGWKGSERRRQYRRGWNVKGLS